MVNTRLRNAFSNPAWICFLWIGLSAGISLIATPARFAAESITRPIALDVSRDVFVALNKAELIVFALLLVVIRLSGRAARLWMFAALLALIVLAQSVWLMPELSARTDLIIGGAEPAPSWLHGAYSTLELLKIAVLLYLGFSSLSDLARPGR